MQSRQTCKMYNISKMEETQRRSASGMHMRMLQRYHAQVATVVPPPLPPSLPHLLPHLLTVFQTKVLPGEVMPRKADIVGGECRSNVYFGTAVR